MFQATPKPEKKQRSFFAPHTLEEVRKIIKRNRLNPLKCMGCGKEFLITVAENPPGRTQGLLVFRTWDDVPSTIHCKDHERGVNNQ